MHKKYQIFISSTFKDMQEERQAAAEAILRAGHIPAGMELFNASTNSQLETIKNWIEECDIYLLILGGRYGTLTPEKDISYIEKEYRYAVALGKPLFSLCISDKGLEEKIKKLNKAAFEDENPAKLNSFREYIRERIVRDFDDAKDIKIAILETLNRFQLEYNLSGWVSGKEMINEQKKFEELNEKYQIIDSKNKDLQNVIYRFESSNKANQYKDYKEAFKVMEVTLHNYIRDETQRGNSSPIIRLNFIGVVMTFSWENFITTTIPYILETNPSVTIQLQIVFIDPSFFSGLPIDNDGIDLKTKSKNRIDEVIQYKKKCAVFSDRLNLSVKTFKNIPHWHGWLVNDDNLFLGRTDWVINNRSLVLRVGQNKYRLFDTKNSEGTERIELFRSWFKFYFEFWSDQII